MAGIQTVSDSDKFFNPFSWNAVLIRDNKYYSVNHYPACISQETGSYKPERVEIRYELQNKSDWDNMHMKRPVL